MKTIIGVDPGNSKCGVAVVKGDARHSEILHRAVVETSKIGISICELSNKFPVDQIAIGNGTSSKAVQEAVRTEAPGHAILILDEYETTIRARERYWEHTPRKWWRRLLPSSMQVPPVPIDDFVAVILAERAIRVD